jgi:hypothetical protein
MNEVEMEEELSRTLDEINRLMGIGEMDNLPTLLMVDGCIRTSTGRYINFTDINPNDICVEDIAHALSMQCRFGGHLPEFYSVAQHSVLCSYLVDECDALEALMHDASEAYMLDIPKPLKNLLPDYEALEERMMRVISDKYGVPHPLSQSVKTADALMLKFEFKSIMLGSNLFRVWGMEESKRRFMERYGELTG